MESNNLSVTTLEKNIQCVKSWSYYDNYQHGPYVYVNENAVGYGPIKVFNATVEIQGKVVFRGDISDRRFEFLKMVAREEKVGIRVHYESSRDSKVLYWTISKKGVARLVDNRWKPSKYKSSKEETDAVEGLTAFFS